jgi:hypothetical protein
MSDLDYRYGRRHRRRGLWITLAVAALIAAVAWAAWAGFRPKEVNGILYGYRVLDEHRVEVTLIVHRQKSQAAICTVYAQAEDHSTVGERQVAVPAGGPEERRVRAVLTTERRAVNGVLRECQPTDG